MHLVAAALAAGHSVDDVAAASGIDAWFVDQIAQVVEGAVELRGRPLHSLGAADLWSAKRAGLSDPAIAALTGSTHAAVRRHRDALGVQPVFKTVDTCAGEFPAVTPYHYSAYELETEVRPPSAPTSSSSAQVRTASVRGSSSTTRASTPRSRSRKPGTDR